MSSENKPNTEMNWLSEIRKILSCIEEQKGVRVDLIRIPLDDKETLDLFTKGDTEGVIGFGSPDMQKYLKQLKPNCFEDLMTLCALYGAGGIFIPVIRDMLLEYIERKTGKLEMDNIHPDVDPVILPTCGMIVYQEQVTEILSRIAGYSTEDAEVVRRMLAKRNPEKMEKIEPEFFCRCNSRGYSELTTRLVWNLMLLYAGLAGRKDLVSLYTFRAYQFAYLKAHFKQEFYAVMASVN